MINNGQLAGFYTAENVEKNPVDFGLKVKRWLHLVQPCWFNRALPAIGFFFFCLSFYPAEPNIILLPAILPLFTGIICFHPLLPLVCFWFCPLGLLSAGSIGAALHTKEFASDTCRVNHFY